MLEVIKTLQAEKHRSRLWFRFFVDVIEGLPEDKESPWYYKMLESYRDTLSQYTPHTSRAWKDFMYGKTHSQVALEITSPQNGELDERNKFISLLIVLGAGIHKIKQVNTENNLSAEWYILGFPGSTIQIMPIYNKKTNTIIGVKCFDITSQKYVYNPMENIDIRSQYWTSVLRGIYYNFKNGLKIKEQFLLAKKVGDSMKVGDQKGTIVDAEPSGWNENYDTYTVVVEEDRGGWLGGEHVTTTYIVKDDPHSMQIISRVSKEVEEKKSW